MLRLGTCDMLIYGQDEFITKWVINQIPHVENFGPCITIGIGSKNRNKLLAGLVYHDYQKNNGTIQLSMASISPMWARREHIAEMLRYPFEQLGIYKVFTTTPEDNVSALKVNAHIGFKREAILAHQFGKKRHAVIMRMLRPDYDRLFGVQDDGQIFASTTANN
jgi:RimJ/RimL family protein N-acetyltransferase